MGQMPFSATAEGGSIIEMGKENLRRRWVIVFVFIHRLQSLL